MLFGNSIKAFKEHIANHFWVYGTICAIALIGIVAGAFTVNAMSQQQLGELSDYMNGFLKIFADQNVSSGDLLMISLRDNFKILLLVIVSGLAIIGIPFVYFLVGSSAFVTGFTIGAMIKFKGMHGMVMALITVIPSEFFILPALIVVGANSVLFSKDLLKKLTGKSFSRNTFVEDIIAYLCMCMICAIIMMVGILFEAYLSPLILKLLLPVF